VSEGDQGWALGRNRGALARSARRLASLGKPRNDEDALPPIEGPTAFGGSPRRFWDLLWLISLQQFRLQYRTSVLGYAWTLLRPLALFGVLYFVFAKILRYGGTIENYPLLLLFGIMLFQFFADGTGTAMGAMVRGENLVRKMHFPRIVIPLSVVISAAMTAVMNLIVALIFVLCFGGSFHLTWFLLPIAFVALTILTTGVSLLLCTTFVLFRDVGQIWIVAIRALFYMTPILYPLESAPAQFHTLLVLNPLAPIITEAKNWVISPDAPGVLETVGWPALLASTAIGVGICVLGVVMFVRQAPRVAERL
jgi:ABC-2 type transport system permease protein